VRLDIDTQGMARLDPTNRKGTYGSISDKEIQFIAGPARDTEFEFGIGRKL